VIVIVIVVVVIIIIIIIIKRVVVVNIFCSKWTSMKEIFLGEIFIFSFF